MPVKEDKKETHMVVFMEIAEQMNGSQAVNSKVKSGEAEYWKNTSTTKDETSSQPLLACLPFEISPWQVYYYEDFTLTNLASGFFGDIYKAEHVVTRKIMCLKAVKMEHTESDKDLYYREIAIMQRLSHPNLLRFIGICVQDNRVHLLTEFINGGNLEELLMNHDEMLYWSERLYIAQDIAKGLAYLHKNRIIHRDLASKNCLIKRANDWKYAVVADLGLATEIPKEGKLLVVGSPYNMAPEMMRGEHYSERADLFSYGIILCEIIARVQADPDELPRTNKFGLDVEKFQNMVGDCPIELLQVAICCCQLDPETRPEFSAVVKILDMILSTHTKRPLLDEDQHLIITPTSPKQTETINQNNNLQNDSNTKIVSSVPAIVVNQEQSHSQNNKLDSKKRSSSFLGKYKLFHSTTDDLLKTTPGKLKSFFNNIIHYREMHVKLRKKKKSKEERNRQSSSSDLKRRSQIPDENTDVTTLKWNSSEPGKKVPSRESSSLTCHETQSLDRVDGCLKTSSSHSMNEHFDVAIATRLSNATESINLSPRGNVSDSESDPFSYSSSLTDSPRGCENDTQSTSSSVHSRSSTDGDVTDQDLDKYRRHSSPLHVFEQLKNLRIEKRSGSYVVSDKRNSADGVDIERNHPEVSGEKSKVKRTKSPFSFLTRKSCRSQTDPH